MIHQKESKQQTIIIQANEPNLEPCWIQLFNSNLTLPTRIIWATDYSLINAPKTAFADYQ